MKCKLLLLFATALLAACSPQTRQSDGEAAAGTAAVYLTQEISPAAVSRLYGALTLPEGQPATVVLTDGGLDGHLVQALTDPTGGVGAYLQVIDSLGILASTDWTALEAACSDWAAGRPDTTDYRLVSIDGPDMLQLLNQNHLSLLVRNHGLTTQHGQRGVQDLLDLLQTHPQRLQGAVCADKIIGKAAAALMTAGGVREVHTNIICQDALDLFERHGVKVTAAEVVPMILNRDRSGQCPIDSRLNEAESVEQCIEILTSLPK